MRMFLQILTKPVKNFGIHKYYTMKNANVTKTKSKKLMAAVKTPGGTVGGTNKSVQKQTTPKGKVGGISKAPLTAVPKAKYGMVMRRK